MRWIAPLYSLFDRWSEARKTREAESYTALSEYLEAQFTEAYKRAHDLDDVAWKSAPFLITMFGIVSTVLGLTAQSVGNLDLNKWFSVAVYVALSGVASSLTYSFWHLCQMLRSRRWRYLPFESETLKWANDLRAYYAATKDSVGPPDHQVLRELRERHIEQLCESVSQIRRQSEVRTRHRARALTGLLTSAGFAFVLYAVTYTSIHVVPAFRHDHAMAKTPPKAPTTDRGPASPSKPTPPPLRTVESNDPKPKPQI